MRKTQRTPAEDAAACVQRAADDLLLEAPHVRAAHLSPRSTPDEEASAPSRTNWSLNMNSTNSARASASTSETVVTRASAQGATPQASATALSRDSCSRRDLKPSSASASAFSSDLFFVFVCF